MDPNPVPLEFYLSLPRDSWTQATKSHQRAGFWERGNQSVTGESYYSSPPGSSELETCFVAVLLKPSKKKSQCWFENSFLNCFCSLLWDLAVHESGAETARELSKEIRRVQTGGRYKSCLCFGISYWLKIWRCSKNQAGAIPGTGFRAKLGQGSFRNQERENLLYFLSSWQTDL